MAAFGGRGVVAPPGVRTSGTYGETYFPGKFSGHVFRNVLYKPNLGLENCFLNLDLGLENLDFGFRNEKKQKNLGLNKPRFGFRKLSWEVPPPGK